jgi:hypothetical protein
MAERLPTTPDGIVCKECGTDKPAYHYFKHSGKYTQDFFTTELGYTPGVCWECAGPYRCVVCEGVKPASEYRVQGRVCNECKTRLKELPRMARETALQALNSDFDANQVSVVLNAENGANDSGWGE